MKKIIGYFLAGLVSASFTHAASYLIEMENYSAKRTSAPEFGWSWSVEGASGGKVIALVYANGYLLYRFDIEEEAKYAIWLRYSLDNDRRLSYAIDPAPRPAFVSPRLKETGEASDGSINLRFSALNGTS